jgi:hypothetical protein
MLTSLAIALTPPGSTAMEATAIQRATEAAYIQSGVSDHVRTVQNQAIGLAKREGKRLGVAKYVGIAGGIVQVARTQTLTFHLSPSSVATVKPNFTSVTFSF